MDKWLYAFAIIVLIYAGFHAGRYYERRTVRQSYDASLETLIDIPAGYYDDMPNGRHAVGARCFPLDTGTKLDELAM